MFFRKLSGGEAKLEVVFQKLNDAKKGIPDDGHRGWKKYGNKSIQNSNHCRFVSICRIRIKGLFFLKIWFLGVVRILPQQLSIILSLITVTFGTAKQRILQM